MKKKIVDIFYLKQFFILNLNFFCWSFWFIVSNLKISLSDSDLQTLFKVFFYVMTQIFSQIFLNLFDYILALFMSLCIGDYGKLSMFMVVWFKLEPIFANHLFFALKLTRDSNIIMTGRKSGLVVSELDSWT